jgi:3-hydroxybutyryl-CoA dehydrogenase
MEAKSVGIVGAGVMGSGIAHLVARATNCEVTLVDLSKEALKKALTYHREHVQKMSKRKDVDADLARSVLKRVRTSLDIEELEGSQIVIECVREDLETKKDVFRQVEKVVKADAILASDTSSLSITAISMAVQDPSRVIGLHFMNPAPIIKIVEIVRGMETSDETFEQAETFCKCLGKKVIVSADTPGFVITRLGAVLLNEAACALHERVASAEDIDNAMKYAYNHPMGPLAVADLIGLDIVLSSLETLHKWYGDPKYRPCIRLRKLVEAGRLGRKTGSGFFEYP